MKASHWAIWSISMNSSGLWAWAMLPGPQTTVGMPASWKRPPSVPKATLPTELAPVSDLTKATISLSTGMSSPGKAEIGSQVKPASGATAERMAREGPFDADFDVAHSTIHTGVVRGGTALNIVPKDCSFDFEFRYVPGVDPEALLAEVKSFAETELAPGMKAVAPEAGFTWEPISAFPGLDVPVESEIVAIVKSLTGANSVGKDAFGTEGGLFHEAGIPTVICGPGSIAQAHNPDEFIELGQIAQCEAFMGRLMDRVCRLPAEA